VLCGLPVVLNCRILCEWLALLNLVRFESACCSAYLKALLAKWFDFPVFKCKLVQEDYHSEMNWLLSRNVKSVDFLVSSAIDADSAPSYLEKHGQHVRSVTWSSCSSAELKNAVLANCPHITSLSNMELGGDVSKLLACMPNVRELAVIALLRYSAPADVVYSQLQSLSLLCCDLTRGNAERLIGSCPNLRKLSVGGGEQMTLFPERLSHLRTLCHSGCDDETLAQVSEWCPHLVHLDVSHSRLCTNIGIVKVATKLKLRSVGLKFSANITNTSIQALNQHCADTLQTLYIDHYVQHSTSQVSNWPALDDLQDRGVQLRWSASTSHSSLYWDNCIRVTDFRYCGVISDEILMTIANSNLSELYVLNLQKDHSNGTPVYTNAGLRAVALSCYKLHSICVNRMVELTQFADFMGEFPHLLTQTDFSYKHDVMRMNIV